MLDFSPLSLLSAFLIISVASCAVRQLTEISRVKTERITFLVINKEPVNITDIFKNEISYLKNLLLNTPGIITLTPVPVTTL
jgi:hypothetical protein